MNLTYAAANGTISQKASDIRLRQFSLKASASEEGLIENLGSF